MHTNQSVGCRTQDLEGTAFKNPSSSTGRNFIRGEFISAVERSCPCLGLPSGVVVLLRFCLAWFLGFPWLARKLAPPPYAEQSLTRKVGPWRLPMSRSRTSQQTKRSMKFTDTGEYVFDLITPRDYRLEVEAKGFNKKVLDNVRALIGKATESDVQLGIGATNTIRIRAREASDHGRKISERCPFNPSVLRSSFDWPCVDSV